MTANWIELHWIRVSRLCLPLVATVFVFDASAGSITLTGTVRDFKVSHPDFEDFLGGHETGIVGAVLPPSKKPVYSDTAPFANTSTAANFDQWYTDVPTVNIALPYDITLTETTPGSGIYGYSDGSFFPIDGLGFGDEGNPHNYHFTYELHTTFTYAPGQEFSFTGDDDLWVFIDNKLAVDLGGVHGALTGSVDLDTLGLVAGTTYDFDLYFAERHTVASSFSIETSIPLVSTVPDAGGTLILQGLAMSLLALTLRKGSRRV